MKRVIVDFTGLRRGTRISDTAQIEYCEECGRKGAASTKPFDGYDEITTLHTVSVRRVLGITFASVDECVTTELPLPPRAPLIDIGETADAHQ